MNTPKDAWPLPAEACPALEPEAAREPGAGEPVPVDGAATAGVVTVGTVGATWIGAVVGGTAGRVGAVGGYAALADYTTLGGQLTVFGLPD